LWIEYKHELLSDCKQWLHTCTTKSKCEHKCKHKNEHNKGNKTSIYTYVNIYIHTFCAKLETYYYQFVPNYQFHSVAQYWSFHHFFPSSAVFINCYCKQLTHNYVCISNPIILYISHNQVTSYIYIKKKSNLTQHKYAWLLYKYI